MIVHRCGLDRKPHSELALFETAATPIALRLAGGGGALGAFLGFVAAGLSVVLVFTAMAGVVAGGLVGVLVGASHTDPTLRNLATRLGRGKVLVSVEPPSRDLQESVERILHSHHARIVRRHLLGPLTRAEQLELDGREAP